MEKFGIDISKWQGDFNFPAALNEGITFAVLKGGGADSGLYVDSKFEDNYYTSKQHNIPVGAYWFSRATTKEEAVNEAEYFYNNILFGKQFELPVFIDVEHRDMLDLGKDELTDIVDTWCSHLESKGYFVGIYASLYTFLQYMNDSVLYKYTHWVAQWANECTYENTDIMGIWQFGGDTNFIRKNTVAGVVCDQNYMYVDFPSVIKQKGFNGFEKNTAAHPTPVPPITNNPNEIKAGDLVKMNADGVIYGTNKKYADFVYNTLLYVRELNGSRAVVSTQAEGAITGAVDIKYLTKYKV